MNTRSSTNTNTNNMFCTYCIKSNQSKELCYSHFLRESRDPDSPVVCPVLNATVCHFCDKPGHIPSHCTSLKNTICTLCNKLGHNAKYCERVNLRNQNVNHSNYQATDDGFIISKNGKTNAPKSEEYIAKLQGDSKLLEEQERMLQEFAKQQLNQSINVRDLEANMYEEAKSEPANTWASVVKQKPSLNTAKKIDVKELLSFH